MYLRESGLVDCSTDVVQQYGERRVSPGPTWMWNDQKLSVHRSVNIPNRIVLKKWGVLWWMKEWDHEVHSTTGHATYHRIITRTTPTHQTPTASFVVFWWTQYCIAQTGILYMGPGVPLPSKFNSSVVVLLHGVVFWWTQYCIAQTGILYMGPGVPLPSKFNSSG